MPVCDTPHLMIRYYVIHQTNYNILLNFYSTITRNDSIDTTKLEQAMDIPTTDVISPGSIIIDIDGQKVTLEVTDTETGDVVTTCEPGQGPAGMLCGKNR